jgi:hypothetical protein
MPRSLSDEIGLSFWDPDMNDPRLMHNRHMVFNLTRPEKSLYLMAPLAKEAGGFGMCRREAGGFGMCRREGDKAVFEDTGDPGYQTLLAMIEAGGKRLNEIERFDMWGFQPRDEWVREMKRYGVLPEDFDPRKEFVDPYKVERQYWAMFEYTGETETIDE